LNNTPVSEREKPQAKRGKENKNPRQPLAKTPGSHQERIWPFTVPQSDPSVLKSVQENLANITDLSTIIQSLKIPQIDLSVLNGFQENLANIADLSTIIHSFQVPQIDLSVLKSVQENIAAITNLSGRVVIDPVIFSKQTLESIARSAQVALPSYYSQPELDEIDKVRPKHKDSRSSRLISRLEHCAPGKANWKTYQDACYEILKHTLVPPLFEPSQESTTGDRSHRRDLVYHIPYEGAGNFWEGIRITYKSLALIIECKNYGDLLRPNQVTITSKYFGEKRLGLFGAIVSRHGFSDAAKREQKRLWLEDGKMILSLTDRDLENMLTLKEAGDAPSKVIDNAIRLFRQSI
jgi:hypothetical protein